MTHTLNSRLVSLALRLGLAFAVLTACVPADPLALSPLSPPADQEGLVTYVAGEAFALRAGTWHLLEAGSKVGAGDLLRVVQDSALEIQWGADTLVRLGPDSLAVWSEVAAAAGNRQLDGELLQGSLLFKVRQLAQGERVRLRAGQTVLGVRGTVFGVAYDGRRSLVTVGEGTVASEDPDQAWVLPAGQTLVQAVADPTPVLSGRSPEQIRFLEPIQRADIVDWSQPEALMRFRIEARPADADLFLGDTWVGRGQVSGLVKVGAEVTYTIRKGGYKALDLTVTGAAGADRIVPAVLDPLPPDSGPGTAPARRSAADPLADSLAQDLARTQEELAALVGQLQEADTAERQLRRDLEGLEAERSRLNDRARQLEGQTQTLGERNRQLETQTQTLTAQLTQTRSDLSASQQERNRLSTEVTRLSGRVQTLESRLQAILQTASGD